jgi:hypothetical protein
MFLAIFTPHESKCPIGGRGRQVYHLSRLARVSFGFDGGDQVLPYRHASGAD